MLEGVGTVKGAAKCQGWKGLPKGSGTTKQCELNPLFRCEVCVRVFVLAWQHPNLFTGVKGARPGKLLPIVDAKERICFLCSYSHLLLPSVCGVWDTDTKLHLQL